MWCCWHAVLTLLFFCDLWLYFYTLYFVRLKIKFHIWIFWSPFLPLSCIYLYCIQIISYYNAEYFRMKLHSSFFYDFEILFPSNWPSGRNIYQFGAVMTISCDGQKSLEDKKIFVSFFGWNNKRCERVEELNTKKGVVVIVSVNEWGISMVLLYHIYFREKII